MLEVRLPEDLDMVRGSVYIAHVQPHREKGGGIWVLVYWFKTWAE